MLMGVAMSIVLGMLSGHLIESRFLRLKRYFTN